MSPSHNQIIIRPLAAKDGVSLRRLFLDVYTVSEFAWPVLTRHVISVHPLAPLHFLLLYVFLNHLLQSWALASLSVISYFFLVWAQALNNFLFTENLEGGQPEVMQLTGHLWDERPRSAFWVAVLKGNENGSDGVDDVKGKEGEEEYEEERHEEKEEVIGSIAVYGSEENEREGVLKRMAVSPAYRRLGVASLLMKHALDFCQQQNFTSVDLITGEAQVSAHRFYETFGFSVAFRETKWSKRIWYLPYENICYRKKLDRGKKNN